MKYFKYLLLGIFFGLVLTKSEAISWFRIQEMFRFQGFHMFGLFLTAIPVGMISVFLIRRFKWKTLTGEEICPPKKQYDHGYILGGIVFGIGWALTGACPGPIYAQIGAGVSVGVVTLLCALAGTWVYSYLRPKLPH